MIVWNKFFGKLVIVFVMITTAACGIVPREGPLSVEIEKQSLENDYVVVDVDADIVNSLAEFDPVGLSTLFSKSSYRSPVSVVGVGDVLAVNIFEAGEGGLFANNAGNGADFPKVAVNRAGKISLPYTGLLAVKGRTTHQIQELIVESLEGKAIQPQAIVNIIHNESNVVTLSGDISSPGLYPISINGSRLLDIIAKAGGAKFPARETYVTFQRGKRQGVQLMKAVIDSLPENIYVSRGDRIYLSHDPQRYTVLGAIKKSSVYTFDAPTVSVLEAIASAGGLLDSRADATGVFVFRYESPKILDSLGIPYGDTIRGLVPTIYRINMKHAQSYFYAQSFHLKDKDSVYVSNATGVEISKILTLINQATSSFGNAARINSSFN